MASSPGDSTPPSAQRNAIFSDSGASEANPERRFPVAPAGIAFVAIVVVVAVVSLLTRRSAPAPAKTLQPLAAYAASLSLSGLEMSESTSLSGGKSTYLDGKIKNTGTATVTGVTVQAVFANDTGMPPQLDTEPLNLIRAREPYVDTEPVSAAPIAPGAEAEFRLIFENLNANWNGQQPEIRVIRVTTR